MRTKNPWFMAAVVLISFLVITTLITTAQAQTSQTTDANGNVTTTEPSDKYGDGGTHATTSDKKFRVIEEVYRDKCGRVRKAIVQDSSGGHQTVTIYGDETGSKVVRVLHRPDGDVYEGVNGKLDPEKGKELVEKWENTPSAPCPDKTATAPPPKPNEPGGGIKLPGSSYLPGLRANEKPGIKTTTPISNWDFSGSSTPASGGQTTGPPMPPQPPQPPLMPGQATSGDCWIWIDVGSGKPFPSDIVGDEVTVNINGVSHGFAKGSGGSWIDVRSGKPFPSDIVGDQVTVNINGVRHGYARVPCPPPSAAVVPGPSVQFGFPNLGGGKGGGHAGCSCKPSCTCKPKCTCKK